MGTLQAAARAQPAAGKKRLPEPASLLPWNPLILLFSTKGSLNSKSWAKGAKPQLAIISENTLTNHLVFTGEDGPRYRSCFRLSSPAHILEVLLQGRESLLGSGKVAGAEGVCEGLKVLATLAHPGALAGSAVDQGFTITACAGTSWPTPQLALPRIARSQPV